MYLYMSELIILVILYDMSLYVCGQMGSLLYMCVDTIIQVTLGHLVQDLDFSLRPNGMYTHPHTFHGVK